VMDEICEYMICQCAVYIGGHFILQGERHDKSQGRGNLCRFRPRENPSRLRLPEETSPRILLSVVSRCCPGIRVLSGISSCKADR
jgi:hypothetical protein